MLIVNDDAFFFFKLFFQWFERWQFIYYLFIYLFIYLWLHWIFVAARGLFSSCGERGLLFIAVHGLLIAVASLVAQRRP